MPIDKPSERGEQHRPDDWERIDAEWAKRDAIQRNYDETHDPGEEWEHSARPLPEDYGKDRPTSRTVTSEQITEMVELWGQKAVDKQLESGRLVLEGGDDAEPGQEEGPTPEPGHDRERPSDHSPEAPNDTGNADRGGGPGDTDPPPTGSPDDEPHHERDSQPDQTHTESTRDNVSAWDNAEGEKPDRARIQVNEARRVHILDGDGDGDGGHFAGTGIPLKSEFPATWNDDKIINVIQDVARNPDYSPELQPNERWRVEGVRDGVEIRAIVEKNGQIWTAHPLGGTGVIQNDENGNPKSD